jgi:hypothetical protein
MVWVAQMRKIFACVEATRSDQRVDAAPGRIFR